ncbi:MAG: histidine kinase [Bacteroidota bacterium]
MESFKDYILPFVKFIPTLVLVIFLVRRIWKWLERRVSNVLLRKNFQLLILGNAAIILFAVLLGSDFDGIIRDIISIEIKVIVIGLLVVNVSYLLEKDGLKKELSFWKIQTRIFVASFLGILIGSLLVNLLLHFTMGEDLFWKGGFLGLQYFEFVMTVVVGLVLISTRLIYQSRNYETLQELNKKELELSRLRELQKSVELDALQAKINPHFLYNALNSIAALVHENADRAEKMAIALSKLFRYSLSSREDHLVSVGEEMEMVKTYLEVEKYRFEENLETSIEIDKSVRKAMIPRFLVQPLVENAIKHGTSQVAGKGEVKVTAKGDGENIELSVYDNGPEFEQDFISGYGLQSIYDKLNLLFKNRNKVELINGDQKHIKITINKTMKHEPAL